MKKQKRIPYESCIIIYFFLQLIYVYANGTCVSVSDEYTYKQIAMDIFPGEAVSSFHYPFVYPFILSLSFYFGDVFYNVMLFENILLKTILLAVIFKMLASVVENREDRGLVLTLIAFSPSYFLYSDWIMAENLFSPLLLITILYYISRRNIMISDTIALKNKLSSSAIAGALAVALFETKYLAIILIPLWFAFWFSCSVPLLKNKKVIKEALLCIICWGISVGLVLGGVVLTYCVKSGCKIDLEIVKLSLGFSSGSGPENTGYKMLPQMKWIICYTAYPFLQAGIIVGENLKIRWKDIPKSIRENIIFLRIISLLLIFVAARHSSLVDYNADGMLKLLGRYVTYIVLIEIIIYAITEKYKKEEKAIDRFFRIFMLVACTVFCYAILYGNFAWKPAEDWLASLRGLENLAFLKLGYIFVIVTCILIVVSQVFGKKITVICWLLFAGVNVYCSLDASEFYADNHSYIKATKELINEYGNEQVSVYSTDMENYLGSLQSFGFLYRGNLDGEFWFLQSGFSQSPISINPERVNFFTLKNSMIDKEKYDKISDNVVKSDFSNVLYVRFDDNVFLLNRTNRNIEVTKTENEIVIKCKEEPSNIVLLVNQMIMPYQYEDGACVYHIERDWIGDTSKAVLYRFSDLTLTHIEL